MACKILQLALVMLLVLFRPHLFEKLKISKPTLTGEQNGKYPSVKKQPITRRGSTSLFWKLDPGAVRSWGRTDLSVFRADHHTVCVFSVLTYRPRRPEEASALPTEQLQKHQPSRQLIDVSWPQFSVTNITKEQKDPDHWFIANESEESSNLKKNFRFKVSQIILLRIHATDPITLVESQEMLHSIIAKMDAFKSDDNVISLNEITVQYLFFGERKRILALMCDVAIQKMMTMGTERKDVIGCIRKSKKIDVESSWKHLSVIGDLTSHVSANFEEPRCESSEDLQQQHIIMMCSTPLHRVFLSTRPRSSSSKASAGGLNMEDDVAMATGHQSNLERRDGSAVVYMSHMTRHVLWRRSYVNCPRLFGRSDLFRWCKEQTDQQLRRFASILTLHTGSSSELLASLVTEVTQQ
ncbi:hypothetical protein CBL_12650 [Carabus blaptoides fortunei]